MTDPLVSIVTPSFNQGQFIEETVLSVLGQDYAPLEHIVFDGCSTDSTAETLRRYSDRVSVTIEPDDGQADAVRKGMIAARGEIVGWLNSDDTYLPGAIRAAVDSLRANPEAIGVFGEAHYTDESGTTIERYPTSPNMALDVGCFVCQPAVFVRRSALAKVGYVDPALRFCLDYDLWIRLRAVGEFVYTPTVLATSRLHVAAKTVTGQLESRREVVSMTHRRFGAAPLTCIFAYADALVRQRVGVDLQARATAGQRVRTILVFLGLATRYHRRIDRRDLRLLAERLRAGHSLQPGATSGPDSRTK